MTPEQLERIKAYLENSKYIKDGNCIRPGIGPAFAFITYQIFDPALIGQFITDAINEKLARINPGSDKIFLDVRNIEPIGITVTVTDKNGKPVVTEFKPIHPE